MEDNNAYSNFVITRYKSASEVSWLKDIHYALTDKYYQEITGDYFEIDDPVNNSLGEQIGTIIDIIECDIENREGFYALIELLAPVNFDTLIQLGVPVENIVFDYSSWNSESDLEYTPLGDIE
jgi:hypothetical protein